MAYILIKFENADTLYFEILNVTLKARAQGLGKQILNHIESIAFINRHSKIRLSVFHKRIELIDFYKIRGFVASGNFEPFPENDPKF